MVRILEQKGYVRSRKEGRGHLYEPAIQKEAYQVASLQHLVSNVFDGTPTLLVQRLVGFGAARRGSARPDPARPEEEGSLR